MASTASAVGQQVTERSSYLYMDVLRFVAASVVVLNHARDLLLVDAAEAGGRMGLVAKALYFVSGLGHEAVVAFFVLSGFWITRAVDRRKDDEIFWRPYLADRLSRLLIVLIPALLLGGALDLWGLASGTLHYSGASPATSVPADLADRLSIFAFLGNLFFLQGLVVPTFGSNGPLWSLAYEFWFYLWFPAILFALRGKWQVALASLVIGAIWPKVALGFLVWLMGTGLYYFDKAMASPEKPRGRASAFAILAGSTAALAIALVVARLGLVQLAISDLLVGAAFSGFLWGLLRLDPAFPAPLRLFALYGSRASYSLYAVHYPILMAILAGVGLNSRMMPGTISFAMVGALVAVAVGFARAFSLVTEARTPMFRTWLRQRLVPATPDQRQT